MANQDFRVKNGLQVGVGGTILKTIANGNIGINSTQPTSKLDVNGHTELDDVNVSGVSTFVGITTFKNNVFINGSLNVGGSGVGNDITTRNLKVSGVSTFTDAIDANGDLDVDGQTELDDLNVSGVSTFAGAADFNGSIDVDGHSELDDVNVSGASTFTGAADFNGNVDIDGHTELDQVNVSGVTTFNSNVNFGTGSTLGPTVFNVNNPATMDSLTIQASLTLDNNVDADFNGNLDVDGHTELDDVNVSGVSTFAGAIDANGDVDIDGHTELDDVNVSGALTAASLNVTDKLTSTGIGISVLNGSGDTATIAGPANLIIDPGVVGDNTGTVRIKGDLIIDGVETKVNSTTVEIADKVIGIATTCTSDLLTDGAGIGIGSDKTFLYEHNSGTNPSLKSSENLNVPTGKGYQVDQTEVLNATTLGSSVVNSSLTSVGTLTELDVNGHTELDDLNVSGVSTFTGTADFNGSVDVDGHTELDDVNVSGALTATTGTFTDIGSTHVVFGGTGGKLEDSANFSYTTGANTLYVGKIDADTMAVGNVAAAAVTISAGIITAATASGIVTYYGDGSNLTGTGIPGISTTGTSTFNNINVSGVSTFGDHINLGDGRYINIGVTGRVIKSSGSALILATDSNNDIKISANDSGGNQADVEIRTGADGGKVYVTGTGGVGIYHTDTAKKLETTSSGVNITGHTETDTLNVSGISTFNDDTYFKGVNTVDVFWDNSENTFDFSDNAYAGFGNSNTLKVSGGVAGGTIELSGTSPTSGLFIKKGGTTESIANFIIDGAVELYYDNSKKLETTSAGATITGDATITGSLQVNSNITSNFGITIPTGQGIALGTGSIFVAASQTVIGTTYTDFLPTGGQDVRHWCDSANIGIVLKNSAGAELHYKNNKKLETTGYGVTVTGGLSVSGISTFQDSVNITGIGKSIRIGPNSDQLQLIYDTSGTGYIQHNNVLFLSSKEGVKFYNEGLTRNTANFYSKGAIELFHSTNTTSSKKFETTSSGVNIIGHTETDTLNVSGIITATSFIGDGSNLTGVGFEPDADENLVAGTDAGANLNGTNGCFNVFLGACAGKEVTSGDSNVAIGKCSSRNITTGQCNISLGTCAGIGITSGSNNIMMGTDTGCCTKSGYNNIILGQSAGKYLYNTNHNIFIGLAAGTSSSTVTDNTGGSNTAIGHCSGYNLSGGFQNIFMGHYSGYCASNGNYNLALGYKAGERLKSGCSNVFIGQNAGLCHQSGCNNISIGSSAGRGSNNPASNAGMRNISIGAESGRDNTSGHDNIFLGYGAGNKNGGGNYNIMIGCCAGDCATSSMYSIFLGGYAGRNLVSGSGNIAIGYGVSFPSTTDNFQTAIGFGTSYTLYSTGNHSTLETTISNKLKVYCSSGIVTATSGNLIYYGDGSNLTGVVGSASGVIVRDGGSLVGTAGTIDFGNNLSVSPVSAGVVTVTGSASAASDKIQENNTSAEVVDTGTDGHFKVLTDGTERFRIKPTTNTYADCDDITLNAGGGVATSNNVTGVINLGSSYSSDGTGNDLGAGSGHWSAVKLHLWKDNTASSNKDTINNIYGLGVSNGCMEIQTDANLVFFVGNDGIPGNDGSYNGSRLERLRIGTNGEIGIAGTNYGSSGQVLTSGGPGAGVTWADAGGGTVFSGTFTATAGSPSTLNTYAYDSAELVFEYTVFVKNGSDYQSQKLLVMRDGTTVHSTQYGVMYSNNPLVELDATISGSNLLLRATPETGVNGSTTYRLKREVT